MLLHQEGLYKKPLILCEPVHPAVPPYLRGHSAAQQGEDYASLYACSHRRQRTCHQYTSASMRPLVQGHGSDSLTMNETLERRMIRLYARTLQPSYDSPSASNHSWSSRSMNERGACPNFRSHCNSERARRTGARNSDAGARQRLTRFSASP